MLLLGSAVILASLRVLTVILFAILVFLVFPSIGVMVFDDWNASAKPTRRARHRRPIFRSDPKMRELVRKFREKKLDVTIDIAWQRSYLWPLEQSR